MCFFADVTNQTAPGKSQTAIENVKLGRIRRKSAAHFRGNGFDEFLFGGFRGFAFLQKAVGQGGPVAQPIAIELDVRGGIFDEAEMGEEKAFGLPGSDSVERLVPQLNVNVRRRRGGKKERIALDANAGGVSDESGAGRGMPEAEMMGSVAGSVDDVEFEVADLNFFAAIEGQKCSFRHRGAIAVERDQVAAVEAPCAGEESRGVYHVGSAEFVDIDAKAGTFADQSASGASVVEVNVGENQKIERSDIEAAGMQSGAQGAHGGFGAGIDEATHTCGIDQQ